MNESELPSAVMQSVSFSGAFRTHPQSVWIADLLFERSNRSVKYVEDGNLLILAEMVEWPDLWPRLFNNLGYLVAFAVSIVFNFMLLLMSLSKSRRTFHKK
ncbi:hypothetical protein AAVH_09253 [Aphelenchoides avenae]|nr:hypothetical protein AAVH_09253 [Aphelenchus avenae]